MDRTDHPDYHSGRPTIGRFGSGRHARIWMLCPRGHYIQGISIQEWPGSLMEARMGDPSYTVGCIGGLPRNGLED